MTDDALQIFREVFGSKLEADSDPKQGGVKRKITFTSDPEKKPVDTASEKPPLKVTVLDPIKVNVRDRLRQLVEPGDYIAIEQMALRFKTPELALRCIWKIVVNNPTRFRSDAFSWKKFCDEISRGHSGISEPFKNEFIKTLILAPLFPAKLNIGSEEGDWPINDSTYDMCNYGDELESSSWDVLIRKYSSLYDRDGNLR